MKNNTVILAPHSYVVVHRKQPNIYDVYEIGTGKWILSRTNPDNILRIFSENCCTFKFIDEEEDAGVQARLEQTMKNFKHKTSKDGIHKLKKKMNKLGKIILKINKPNLSPEDMYILGWHQGRYSLFEDILDAVQNGTDIIDEITKEFTK